MDSSTYIKIVEIMSGKAVMRQGLTATCKTWGNREDRSQREDDGLTHEPVGAKKAG